MGDEGVCPTIPPLTMYTWSCPTTNQIIESSIFHGWSYLTYSCYNTCWKVQRPRVRPVIATRSPSFHCFVLCLNFAHQRIKLDFRHVDTQVCPQFFKRYFGIFTVWDSFLSGTFEYLKYSCSNEEKGHHQSTQDENIFCTFLHGHQFRWLSDLEQCIIFKVFKF